MHLSFGNLLDLALEDELHSFDSFSHVGFLVSFDVKDAFELVTG